MDTIGVRLKKNLKILFWLEPLPNNNDLPIFWSTCFNLHCSPIHTTDTQNIQNSSRNNNNSFHLFFIEIHLILNSDFKLHHNNNKNRIYFTLLYEQVMIGLQNWIHTNILSSTRNQISCFSCMECHVFHAHVFAFIDR